MQILSVFFCKIFLCHLHYNAGQQEHGDQVGNDHESIESLGDAPHESQVHGSAYDSCKGMLEREPKRNSIHLVPYSPQPMIVENAKQHIATAVKIDTQLP